MTDAMIIKLDDYASITLPTLYQAQTHLTKYSRWLPELKRRETWPETVFRFLDFLINHAAKNFGYRLTEDEQRELCEAIIFLRNMPSMRAMMTAGLALELDHVAAYNCAYLPVTDLAAHAEAFYLSMCAVGVGFSVERQWIGRAPDLPKTLQRCDAVIEVPDDRIGWADSYRRMLTMLFTGFVPHWDVSKVRPAGAALKTFGGRASGPAPLVELFHHAINIVSEAVHNGQTRLNSFQQHDLMTKMADVAVSGGVRRAAMISLSNPSDRRMREAKAGSWFTDKPHFSLANNSEVWTDHPSSEEFMESWLALVKSKNGERGVINRQALVEQCRRTRRLDVDRYAAEYGLNPCAEVILRPYQFCNLSTSILRAEDGLASILKKMRVATILGTLQSTLTNFRYIRSEWRKNCEEERLLGVSLNGIFDNRYMAGLDYVRDGTYLTENFVVDGVKIELPQALAEMRDVAVKVNAEWADKLGINRSAAITSIKPEGNNSSLVGCSSGLHGAHAKPFYIRTNRANKVDKLGQFLTVNGVYTEDDVRSPHTTSVLFFPIHVPHDAVTRSEYTAIEHLDIWKIYQQFYCEHKPSITVSVRDSEWLRVGSWVYDNFGLMSGVAFLPFSDANYLQMPYMDCTEEEFIRLDDRTPRSIDFSEFSEDADYTESAKTFACVGGVCEF